MFEYLVCVLVGLVVGAGVGFFIGGHNAKVAATIVAAAHTASAAGATAVSAAATAAKSV